MITTKGVAVGITGKRLFRIGDDSLTLIFSDDVIVKKRNSGRIFSKYVISSEILIGKKGIGNVNSAFIDSLNIGDIISVSSTGVIVVLWQQGNDENLLYVTDYCNSRCIMCPQIDFVKPNHYYEDTLKLIEMVHDKPTYLCISGGEPTLDKENYLKVVSAVQKKFPSLALQVLTNGKNFKEFSFSKRCALNSPVNTMYAIPLYSSNSSLHDEIVASKGSFEATISGIMNLYRLKQTVEIRIVITKNNYMDLDNLAHFIYWNMPFVFRVSFMGMETHGSAAANVEDVWVDPSDYLDNLTSAVQFLHYRGIMTVIYNLPQCVLNEPLQSFAQDSISAWKKSFIDECNGCSKKKLCSGIFSTSIKLPNNIHKI